MKKHVISMDDFKDFGPSILIAKASNQSIEAWIDLENNKVNYSVKTFGKEFLVDTLKEAINLYNGET